MKPLDKSHKIGYNDFFSKTSSTVDIYGDNPIVHAVNGKDQVKVWNVINELMEAIQVLAPNLYEATLDKLNNI